jgi:hypothetical protein
MRHSLLILLPDRLITSNDGQLPLYIRRPFHNVVFLYRLYYNAYISYTKRCRMVGWRMNWKRFGRKLLWCRYMRYYPDICLEGLRKSTRNGSKNFKSWPRTASSTRKHMYIPLVHHQPTGTSGDAYTLQKMPATCTHFIQKETNSVALSPRANYTDWATATFWRNLVPTFVDRGVSRGQHGG